MTEISSNNLNAHYTNQAKVEKPENTVAIPPQTLPSRYAFDENAANKKFEAINKDIYEGAMKEKEKPAKKFWTKYIVFVAAVLGIIGIRRRFK